MAFNLYFAGSQNKIVEQYFIDKKIHRLVSQIGERNVIQQYSTLQKQDRPTLLVDSGAFSVAHNGKVVILDDYINYINTMDNTVDYWAELDVIPYPVLNMSTAKESSEASWKNYLYMLNKVKNPHKILPLYHFGEPLEHLYRILNTPVINGKPAEYIGIGGRHGVSTEDQIRYFEKVFNIIKHSSNPNVKVHAFGVTVFKILERFPFYSSDSTTWLQVAVNGGIITKYGIYPISDRGQYKKDSYHQCDSYTKRLIEEEIVRKGYTDEELRDDYTKRLLFNIDYFIEWAENYQYKPSTYQKKKLI